MKRKKKVDLGFVGSCMVHKGDIKIVAQMLKNLEKETGDVKFKAPLVIAPPTYNIVEELKAEGDWEILQKYSGFEFDDLKPKTLAREKYENVLYLERPGCNLCMGNQEFTVIYTCSCTINNFGESAQNRRVQKSY